jgi:hypothetical protein
MTTQRLTFPELFGLPTVVDLRTAARAVGISTTTAYRLAGANRFPCPILRIGWRYQVPTSTLMKAIGIDQADIHRSDVERGVTFAQGDS